MNKRSEKNILEPEKLTFSFKNENKTLRFTQSYFHQCVTIFFLYKHTNGNSGLINNNSFLCICTFRKNSLFFLLDFCNAYFSKHQNKGNSILQAAQGKKKCDVKKKMTGRKKNGRLRVNKKISF